MTSAEYLISYNLMGQKEQLPGPKFSGVYWQGVPEEGQIVGQVIEMDGERSRIEVIGFQGSEGAGSVKLHQEPDQREDVFFLAGAGEMGRWDGLECGRSSWIDTQLVAIGTRAELACAQYTLAIASYIPKWGNTRREHLVLNVEMGGKTVVVEPIITPQGHYHATRLDEASLYFVVKHSRIE